MKNTETPKFSFELSNHLNSHSGSKENAFAQANRMSPCNNDSGPLSIDVDEANKSKKEHGQKVALSSRGVPRKSYQPLRAAVAEKSKTKTSNGPAPKTPDSAKDSNSVKKGYSTPNPTTNSGDTCLIALRDAISEIQYAHLMKISQMIKPHKLVVQVYTALVLLSQGILPEDTLIDTDFPDWKHLQSFSNLPRQLFDSLRNFRSAASAGKVTEDNVNQVLEILEEISRIDLDEVPNQTIDLVTRFIEFLKAAIDFWDRFAPNDARYGTPRPSSRVKEMSKSNASTPRVVKAISRGHSKAPSEIRLREISETQGEQRSQQEASVSTEDVLNKSASFIEEMSKTQKELRKLAQTNKKTIWDLERYSKKLEQHRAKQVERKEIAEAAALEEFHRRLKEKKLQAEKEAEMQIKIERIQALRELKRIESIAEKQAAIEQNIKSRDDFTWKMKLVQDERERKRKELEERREAAREVRALKKRNEAISKAEQIASINQAWTENLLFRRGQILQEKRSLEETSLFLERLEKKS
eukprot:TRINITY_DN4667_c0_g1_i5.p1 TRINITY_DN4667_c0_g1~~TRINITY_DN4667_c0_g1_i5.p1  ORF type:complete len:525 (-),score=94.78 TRINITY_DN4667_c0_g1_i5:59-1633(-)